MRTYQVEYFDRTSETDKVVPYDDKRPAAHSFARRMSDKHDGSAYVVVSEGVDIIGHSVYVYGSLSEHDGDVK